MRKTKNVVIPPDATGTPDDQKNRDAGKVYIITEMPASQAERWAFRAFQALARSGVDLPENTSGAGMAGLAHIGLQALSTIPYNEANDLMDEMFSCVKIMRNKETPLIGYDLMEEDVEEVRTRVILRTEVFELHTGFSMAGVRQSLTTSTPATP